MLIDMSFFKEKTAKFWGKCQIKEGCVIYIEGHFYVRVFFPATIIFFLLEEGAAIILAAASSST